MSNLEAIRKRIDPMPHPHQLHRMSYQLWFDCRYLISELDYYKQVCKELEKEIRDYDKSF